MRLVEHFEHVGLRHLACVSLGQFSACIDAKLGFMPLAQKPEVLCELVVLGRQLGLGWLEALWLLHQRRVVIEVGVVACDAPAQLLPCFSIRRPALSQQQVVGCTALTTMGAYRSSLVTDLAA